MSMKGAMALMTLSGMFSLSKANRELMNTCGWVGEREREEERDREERGARERERERGREREGEGEKRGGEK
jgi:hypothetical protein